MYLHTTLEVVKIEQKYYDSGIMRVVPGELPANLEDPAPL